MVRANDVTLQAPEIAAAASVLDNGEVSWPVSEAEAAINALADAGLVILGLDMREYDNDGRFFERPVSAYEPAGSNDVEPARQAALEALQRGRDLGNAVLINWEREG